MGEKQVSKHTYVTNDIKTKLLNEKEYHIDSDQNSTSLLRDNLLII